MMLEEGEIDEDFDLTPNLNVNTTSPTAALINNAHQQQQQQQQQQQLSPSAASDHSSSSKASSTKRKSRHKSQNSKRKKVVADHCEDKDERFSWPESNKLAEAPVVPQQAAAPISLFDLFKQSQQNDKDSYLNPVITEKENNKPVQRKSQPLLSLPQEYQEMKRKTLLAEPDESEMTVSVESIEKKMEKKRKYAEIQKERQKKEAEKQQLAQEKREKILCQFFLSGRCQKGDKCPFSHQAPKKYELCKFYANGYCSKLDKCFFMHSEFPCKFFHRGQCTQGDKCRFSHESISNPQLQDAFDKYLNEISHDTVIVPKPSLLGIPSIGLLPTPEPVPLMKLPIKSDVDERDLLQSGDVDLRAFNSLNEFDRLKKELIAKIMKNLSENPAHPEIPKTVLAELLVKLLNTDNIELAKTLTIDALKTLLTTLSEKTVLVEIKTEPEKADEKVEEEYKLEINIDEVKDENEDEYDACMPPPQEIQGHCGEFEWKLYEIDIEPSTLWANPPSESLELDQESDPRVKYYSNKTNCNNVANYHLKVQQQNLQRNEAANASPIYSEPIKSNPIPSVQKPVRVDPRLASRSAQQSSPPPPDNKIDLLNRPLKDQSLLSSLPDIQIPKDLKNSLLNATYPSNDSITGSGTRLSIEDYKRKLQKPSAGSTSNLTNLSRSPEEVKSEPCESKSLLPNIPSYTINLQAPQSLHELLRNFQS